MKRSLTALFLGLTMLLTACSQTQAPASSASAPASPTLQELYDSYISAVSPDFAYDVALELTTNPSCASFRADFP